MVPKNAVSFELNSSAFKLTLHLCFHYIRKFTIPTFHNFYIILDIFTFRDAICKIAIICQKFTRSIRHRR